MSTTKFSCWQETPALLHSIHPLALCTKWTRSRRKVLRNVGNLRILALYRWHTGDPSWIKEHNGAFNPWDGHFSLTFSVPTLNDLHDSSADTLYSKSRIFTRERLKRFYLQYVPRAVLFPAVLTLIFIPNGCGFSADLSNHKKDDPG